MATFGQFTSYSVDNDRKFRQALTRARLEVGDLRIPLREISRDFYKSQKAIFLNRRRGQYPDLSPAYKELKKKKYGFIYPILRATGALEKSVTTPNDSNSINNIINKSVLIIGTRVSYGIYHQSDAARRKIPLRKFLFIGPEAPQFADSEQTGRLERWLGILDAFVAQRLQQLGRAA